MRAAAAAEAEKKRNEEDTSAKKEETTDTTTTTTTTTTTKNKKLTHVPKMAIATLESPVNLGASDGRNARVVCLVLVPMSAQSLSLHGNNNNDDDECGKRRGRRRRSRSSWTSVYGSERRRVCGFNWRGIER